MFINERLVGSCQRSPNYAGSTQTSKKCNLVLTQRSMDPEKLQQFVNKNFKDPHLDFKTYNKGKSKPYGTEIIMGR